MKKVFIGFILFFVATLNVNAQNAILRGNVSDEKTGETIVGATIILEGTTTGTITDFDGNFEVKNIVPGKYKVRCSFISYAPQIFDMVFDSNEEKTVNFSLGEAVVEVAEVNVIARVNRESEILLLLDQREAGEIKESIGAQQLSALGVSDAAAATSKISGVTKNEGSGDIYIRGLGDRYLMTTMNGLPIPSDDVNKKNIDLNLFATDVIKNVGITKTFTAGSYADQTSGAVDIVSKTSSKNISVDISAGSNSNIFGNNLFNNFRGTQNMANVNFGFYKQTVSMNTAISNQSWNTTNISMPFNRSFSIIAGKSFSLFNNNASFFATLSHDNSFEHQKGIYKKYRSNVLDNSFTDAETFSSKYNTTGLLNFSYDFKRNNSINFNSLYVSKTIDALYEQGRNGEGYVFDQDPQEYGAFVRDQNLKINQLFISQLIGTHQLSSTNKLNWAMGYNKVNSREPNRIRNEVNILDENTVQFAHVGDFQQRKSSQDINDFELNAYINNNWLLVEKENKKMSVNYGANFRYKQREFSSIFVGLRAKGVQTESIDNLDQALINQDLYKQKDLLIRDRKPDIYSALLGVYAAYMNLQFETGKLSGNAGIRYEYDLLNVDWDVSNYVGRIGSKSNPYNNLLPTLNIKYQVSQKSAVRMAAGKTVTLPEFKELAPFEYVSPTGRVTKGNPDLKSSVNYNFDAKWEIYPSNKELVSISTFYKLINNPINLAQTRGSSGNFIYENTGKQANVYGIEAETRVGIIKPEVDGKPELNFIMNATKMWFSQDLLEEFRYNNKTETALQGASGFIANASLSFSNNTENEFAASVTGNYSSDKILALGAPEDFVNSAELFNSAIVEKGFTTIDVILSKKLTDKISLKLTGKNLLNPRIEQIQEIKPFSGESSTEVVSSYRKGVSIKLGLKINLN